MPLDLKDKLLNVSIALRHLVLEVGAIRPIYELCDVLVIGSARQSPWADKPLRFWRHSD